MKIYRIEVIPSDCEDIIYMLRRAEYKRGKADGFANATDSVTEDNVK